MIFKRNLIIVVFIFSSIVLFGQKHQYNWLFGENNAIEFDKTTAAANITPNNSAKSRISASISDSTTGELLFYTDGNTVWNKNHQIMPNGNAINATFALGVIAVPNPSNPKQYYIFTIDNKSDLAYTSVDMSLNGGLGEVTSKAIFLAKNTSKVITAVKHKYNNSYWLISHSNLFPEQNSFLTYGITVNGVSNVAVVSAAGKTGGTTYGVLVSNGAGNKLALTDNNAADGEAQVFDFDKECGIISNAKTLHKETTWSGASYGAAFSPDDSKLYISYWFTECQLIQYSGAAYDNWGLITKNNRNFTDFQLGPDNKLYITINYFGAPTTDISVLHNPNNAFSGVGYQAKFLDLGVNSVNGNYEFPNFINDNSNPDPSSYNPTISFIDVCVGDSTRFSITGISSPPDSLWWQFIDTNSTSTTSSLINPKHVFSQKGIHTVVVSYYRCGIELIFFKQVNIIEPQQISLGVDTGFCHNDTLVLKTDAIGMKHLWSTGETTETIVAKQGGIYWVQVTSPVCKVTDSIEVTAYPPILINLGGDFTVCEHDTADLVKLDAGKGYKNYKWAPTNDTTQWIIVKQAGDYYVVVEDYRGCKGDDGSKIARLCNFDFYIPNAFTPNGDGINDVFKTTALDIEDYEIEVYNLWGERVFNTNTPEYGWDGIYKGKQSPQGVYLYKVKFKGLSNKQLRNYNFKGNVSLLR